MLHVQTQATAEGRSVHTYVDVVSQPACEYSISIIL